MKLKDLNEGVISTRIFAKKLIRLLKLDEYKYIFKGNIEITCFLVSDDNIELIPRRKQNEANITMYTTLKNTDESDHVEIISFSTTRGDITDKKVTLRLKLSNKPTKKALDKMKISFEKMLNHEATHIFQILKRKPKTSEELSMNQNKFVKTRKSFKSSKIDSLKDYFSKKDELMAYANQFSMDLTLNEFKHLSNEIKYNPKITDIKEIKSKYSNHKWFTPTIKQLFIYLTIFSRTDKIYKRLVKYFTEYLKLQSEN